MPNPVGRPSKFTPEAREKLLTALRKGAPYELACNYARISYSLFREWVIEAERGENPDFVEFLDNLREVEGHTALIWLDKIDKAMNDGAWQAAAWKLERRHFKHFSSHAAVLELAEEMKALAEKQGFTEKEQGNGEAK